MKERRRIACTAVALLAGGVVWGAGSTARAQSKVIVSVDGTAAGTPLERVWPYHGFDEVNYSTTTDGKALLKTLAMAHTVPPHVRTHFLLNTGNGTPSLKWGSTNAYTEDASGNPVYSWTLMDGIMDAITGAGALPFAEIAFMPQALSTMPNPYMNSGTYNLDGGSLYPPKDYTKWGNLVAAWAAHANGRYPNVASSWLWELWNEPDIAYWHGTPAEYDKLYDYTEAALHGALPTAPLGGPAVSDPGGSFLKQFLQHTATGTNAVSGKAGARLDLITFHAKGGVAVTGGHVEMNLGNQLRLHQSGFAAVTGVAMYRQTPIYITEADPDGCAACPVSMTPADAYRNSPAYGAYEVAMMKRTIELAASSGVKLGGVLAWAFTFPGTPYFAGYRALTTNGIELPVLGAFKLLGSLAGTRLPVTSSGAATLSSIMANSVRGGNPDVDAMAALDGDQLRVLVWNYHDDLVATAAAAPVELDVKVPASFGGRVTLAHLRVDDTHGDAYTVWTGQGSPAAPSATQLAALRAAMDPVALGAAQTLDVAGGSVSVTFDLPRFGISLLTLGPAAANGDASADGVPADAAMPADGPPPPDAAPPADAARDAPAEQPEADAAATPDAEQGGADGGDRDGAPSERPASTDASDDSPADASAQPLDAASDGIIPPDAGGATRDGSGGLPGSGGATATGSGGAPGQTGASSNGCACAVAQRDNPAAARVSSVALLGLALLIRRRRQRARSAPPGERS